MKKHCKVNQIQDEFDAMGPPKMVACFFLKKKVAFFFEKNGGVFVETMVVFFEKNGGVFFFKGWRFF